MKNPSPTKDLYRQLRALPPEQLWNDEVPAFDRASPAERTARVGLIRALGVVLAESGTADQRTAAATWLHALLDDPDEKIRRYAAAALPKIAPGPATEVALLARFARAANEREKRHLARDLERVGGAATLAHKPDPALERAALKARANVQRTTTPTTIRLDHAIKHPPAGLRIHLHCRAGLEDLVAEEAQTLDPRRFRILQPARARVALAPLGPFTLADLLTLRCFHTAALVLGTSPAGRDGSPNPEALAALIAAPATLALIDAFTTGPLRYRLEFPGAGHRRSAVREIGERVFALEPRLLNDSRDAPWQIDVRPTPAGHLVELRPRLRPDPRFAYRGADVPAASHPPLAAAIARLAGPGPAREIVWDPFCGSGLELIERALLHPGAALHGSDLDPAAVAITRANLAAALPGLNPPPDLHAADFRDVPRLAGWRPGALTLIVTNPPLGRRVPIPDLPELIADLFAIAARYLRPGGRLVLANPLPITPAGLPLQRTHRRKIDLGGFHCHLERYVRTKDNP